MADRIQLSRAAGWRMPAGAVKVDRSTRWGNPWRIEHHKPPLDGVHEWSVRHHTVAHRAFFCSEFAAVSFAVSRFKQALLFPLMGGLVISIEEIRAELAGKDLACWCRPGAQCHADVLLSFANDG